MSDNNKFGPPKGMRDWLPMEALLRQKTIKLIEHQYQLYGFQPIDTPVLENIDVLQGKGGGENEKLMFNVMKRGEDLNRATRQMTDTIEKRSFSELSDMGLRFDLTVPLARYYANHSNELPKPFRCYHIGPVWRADRPQKGRYREFYQCDIDIVGGSSNSYETELLLATDRVLKNLNVGKFKIRISDKRLLPALLVGMGVESNKLASVAVSIDKLDKQPLDQVMAEIESLGHSLEVLSKVDGFIKNALHKKLDPSHFRIGQAEALWENIESISQSIFDVNPEANVIFDPLLVRGFDYYTGPIFEINLEDSDFNFSIGGGGRYDGLIEKLGGPKETPAVGISLGFERILLILNQRNNTLSPLKKPVLFIANSGQTPREILALAEILRSSGIQVETSLENKKMGLQLETAQKNGIEYAITEIKQEGHVIKFRTLSTREDREMPLQKLIETLKNFFTTLES